RMRVVGVDELGLPSRSLSLADGRPSSFVGDVRDDHARSFLSEQEGRFPPDATPASGNQRHFVLQPHGPCPSIRALRPICNPRLVIRGRKRLSSLITNHKSQITIPSHPLSKNRPVSH